MVEYYEMITLVDDEINVRSVSNYTSRGSPYKTFLHNPAVSEVAPMFATILFLIRTSRLAVTGNATSDVSSTPISSIDADTDHQLLASWANITFLEKAENHHPPNEC